MATPIPFDQAWKRTKHRYRDQIKAEFDHGCAYCGRQSQELTLDHVLPHCQGGQDTRRNLIPACRRCNLAKGSRSVLDWYTPDLPYFCAQRLHRILERRGEESIRSRRQGGGFA